jgi:hypothetical protein
MRGDNALAFLLAANNGNPEPDEGYEYLAARLRVHYRHVNEEMTYISTRDFTFYSPAQGTLPPLNISVTTDQLLNWLNATLYPGATLEAWTVIQVPIGETNPVLVFTKQQPIYLALQ